MASPKLEVFFLFDQTTGEPVTGQTGIAFETYKNDQGVNVLPQPTISEIGGGAYGFLPVFADADRGIVYVIECGSDVSPARVSRYMRPEDWRTDNVDVAVSTRASQTSVDSLGALALEELEEKVDRIIHFNEGKWQIHTTGSDANRLVIYDEDGTTVLVKFDLYDSSGIPTSVNPYKKVPVE